MATIRPTGYLAHYGFSEEDVLKPKIKESIDRLDNVPKSSAKINKTQDDDLKKTEDTKKSMVAKKASGLDPRGKAKVNKLLKNLNAKKS